jgi:enoyl-CoA hydratase
MSRTLQLATQKMQARIDDDAIGWIVFNQPERRNAISLEMWQGLADILDAFAADPTVRVAVMRGAGGKAFVSGADISEFDRERGSAEQKEAYARVAGKATRRLARFDKPLIALIEGFCIGGGLATALAADVRFATPDSTFGIPAARLGLGYEYEGLAKLARVVGPARARDILFSARLLPAAEAHDAGLVNFLADRDAIEADVVAYAQRIAGNAPLTVRAAKAALNAWERGGRPEEVEQVRTMVDACFDSDDYREGRRAFSEKRPPAFRGR